MRFVDLLVLEVNGFYRVSLISHLSCVLIKFVEEIQIQKNVTSQELKVVHKMGKNALVRQALNPHIAKAVQQGFST